MKLLGHIIRFSAPVGVGLLVSAKLLGLCSPPWWVLLLPFAPAVAVFVLVCCALFFLIASAHDTNPFQ